MRMSPDWLVPLSSISTTLIDRCTAIPTNSYAIYVSPQPIVAYVLRRAEFAR